MDRQAENACVAENGIPVGCGLVSDAWEPLFGMKTSEVVASTCKSNPRCYFTLYAPCHRKVVMVPHVWRCRPETQLSWLHEDLLRYPAENDLGS